MPGSLLDLPKRHLPGRQPPAPEIDMDLLRSALDYIRPAVQADGGDLILSGVEGGVVSIQMVGACGGCPLSMMTGPARY